jgi:peptidoglycan/xylan/chitin deacetylase (PgdA/CDA1 family)
MRASRGCFRLCSGPSAIPRRSELVLTFDNLGEATELERGGRPSSLGSHPSVTEALPWLLDALDACGLRATFFVEGINCELYPDEVRGIASRGHELGMHGWRHEEWSGLSVDREREILERCVAAFGSLGLSVRGFRPPGGELTARSVSALLSVGVSWCSPVGEDFRVSDGLAWVPFEWDLVDAYYLMDSFADLRAARGDSRPSLAASALVARFIGAVRAIADSGSRATLILHPFLMLDPTWREGVDELLEEIGTLARAGDLWVGPGGAFAERQLPNEERDGGDQGS